MIRHKSFQVLLKEGLIAKRKTYIFNECLYKYKNDVNDPTSDIISGNENTRMVLMKTAKCSNVLEKQFPTSEKQFGLI